MPHPPQQQQQQQEQQKQEHQRPKDLDPPCGQQHQFAVASAAAAAAAAAAAPPPPAEGGVFANRDNVRHRKRARRDSWGSCRSSSDVVGGGASSSSSGTPPRRHRRPLSKSADGSESNSVKLLGGEMSRSEDADDNHTGDEPNRNRSISLRSVVHHPFGVPLVWFLNQRRWWIDRSPSSKGDKDEDDKDRVVPASPTEPDQCNGSSLSEPAADEGLVGLEASPIDDDGEEDESARAAVAQRFPHMVALLEAVDTGGTKAPSDIDRVLQESYEDYRRECSAYEIPKGTDPDGDGRRLTGLLRKRIETALQGSGLDAAHPQAALGPPKQNADVVVAATDPSNVVVVCYPPGTTGVGNGGGGGKDACLCLEVGFSAEGAVPHASWNMDHQRNFLDERMMLPTGKRNKVRCTSKPMLRANLTIQKGDDFRFSSGRLGVFLVTPKNKCRSRACLLAQTEATDLDNLSSALGRVLRAALALPNLQAESIDFESLGPHCCRIGGEVLRSYDSRLHPTQRRPDVYLLLPELVGPVRTLVKCEDTEAFSEASRGEPDRREDERGSLVVLAVQHHHGRHWTDSFSECVHVVRALEALHKRQCVHGDIRAFNIVFGANTLIDHDFGGTVNHADGTPTYPVGYQQYLPDGVRFGKAGRSITMHDDWDALREVLTHVHNIFPLAPCAVQADELNAKMSELRELCEVGMSVEELTREGGIVEGVASAVVNLLETAEAQGCRIAPTSKFLNDLRDVGLYPDTPESKQEEDGA